MKFRTEIELKKWSEPLEYSHQILCLGSCFATTIADHLRRSKFRVVASPTGTLFNPASIALAVRHMSKGYKSKIEDITELDGNYVNYNFHSQISAPTYDKLNATVTTALEQGAEALRNADLTIITLGTAWVYRLRSTGEVVANCHKQPQRLFSRELLTVDECVAYLEEIVTSTPSRLLLTVSPVRHIGEGLEDNSLSKAILRVAIDIICRRHSDRVVYFPSFEMLVDDLRDYRFYADDLVHPSSKAVEYIVEKFYEAAISPRAKATMERVNAICAAVNHRPRNPQSEAYREFCLRQLEAINGLECVDLSQERATMERMLQINL
ncbi:MAG: GSCFA domain-containing protein [Alistipes sp.]|nr:GSCFA domain-containing protein [Alistipes sp.]